MGKTFWKYSIYERQNKNKKDKKMNKEGAISGMLSGIIFTAIYILHFKPQLGGGGLPENYLFGISPEGIGTIGMIINFIVSLIVSRLTRA